MNEIMSRNQGGIARYRESKELSQIKGRMYLARQFPRDPEWALPRSPTPRPSSRRRPKSLIPAANQRRSG